MAAKILFGNYKGGVGKTTSTYQAALALNSRDGSKVLLIDLDSQSSLSEIYCELSGEILNEIPHDETLNYILYQTAKNQSAGIEKQSLSCTEEDLVSRNSYFVKSKNIIKTENGIDFILNSLYSEYGGLDTISIDYMNNCIGNLLILRNFIENNDLDSKYDYILFDCPPSDNLITRMAFLYCDYYVIPTIMDRLSARGVKHYIYRIEGVYEKYCIENGHAKYFGGKPGFIGIFETMRKGNTNTDRYRFVFDGLPLFRSFIRHLKEISESTGSSNISSCHDYFGLTQELKDRVQKLNRRKN